METVPDRRFHCHICQRSFTRNDHLKRHQLRHTGAKPYHCQFCTTTFSRSDSLRDHYVDCSSRGNRDVPATGSGGRRRHACLLCINMKLKCDGDSPCGSCSKRKAKCSNSNSADVSRIATTSRPVENPKNASTEHVFDRGSIQFLLNGGSEGWVSSFQFPPTDGQSAYQDQRTQTDEAKPTPMAYETFTDMPDLSFADETFGNFFTGPFGFASGEDISSAPTPRSLVDLLPLPNAVPEAEQSWAISLLELISSHIPLHSPHRDDLLGNLQFLFTTSRMRRAIELYFSNWHVNSRIIHQSSFDPANTSPTLLVAVVFMGMLYSREVLETYAAKALLDYAELFCFRSRTFSCEAEIEDVFAMPGDISGDDKQRAFEDLQAGYLMVVTQHWAGNKMARRRAMETRFSEVVKVARRQNLTRCRQTPEDRSSEALWLNKESRIRTMAYITLVDCALSFFQNFPCRLVATELECDLPCPEPLFDCQHPYSEPGFLFSRPMTVNSAFEQILASVDGCGPLSTIGLTVLDMFLIVHLLYAHVNTQMTLLTPLLRARKPHDIDQDTSVLAIKSALSTWRSLWVDVRSKISEDEWAKMGFWKNGYNYWSVAQLLINQKEKVDLVMRMELGGDKLEKLKLLLQDDSD